MNKPTERTRKLHMLPDRQPTPTIQESPLLGLNGQLMVTASHRYCLGRQSYIVSSCIEWLRKWWPQFERNTKNVLLRDTVEALQDGLAGAEMDTRGWREFADWAFEQLDAADKKWVVSAVAHRHKPWPLTDPLTVDADPNFQRFSISRMSNKIYFLGDSHSVQPVIRLCRDIPAGATVIHVGDFGAWDVPQFWRDIDDLNHVLEKRDLNLYVIRGNHDQPDLFSETRNINRVHMLADYTEKVINGKRFLFVGGGYSVDRVPRLKNGWVYDANEPMIYRKTAPCDVLVTHTGPRRFLTELLTFPIDRYYAMDANLKADLQREQDMVDDILRDCQPKVHVWGHFHVEKRDYEGGTIFQCLDVNQVKTLAEIES